MYPGVCVEQLKYSSVHVYRSSVGSLFVNFNTYFAWYVFSSISSLDLSIDRQMSARTWQDASQ